MSDSNLPNKVLVVDDDPAIGKGLEDSLVRYKIKVDKASDLETTLYLFNQQRYEVVLVELEFAPLPGLALIQKWRGHEVFEKGCTGFIMMGGNNREEKEQGLIRELGELELINKPFSTVQILPFLSRALAAKKRAVSYHELKSKVINYYAKTGEFEKAATHVQKKLSELGPNGLNVLYDLYEKAGRYEDALALVDGMLARDQSNIGLLNAKGRLLMRVGKFGEAREALEKADKLAPQNIERINEMADMYLHLKEPDKAVDKFKQLVDVNPENPDVKFDAFTKLYDHGFDDHAVAFGKQTTRPMEIVRHYNNKGVLMSKSGDGESAVGEYHRALKFFPNFKENYRIYFNIALANINLKTRESLEEAKKNLEICLKMEPNFEKAKKILDTIKTQLTKKKPAKPAAAAEPAVKEAEAADTTNDEKNKAS